MYAFEGFAKPSISKSINFYKGKFQMALRDIYNNKKVNIGLDVAVIGSNTTTVGNIIDMQGFDSIMWEMFIGALTDGSYLPLIEDGEDAGLSDAAPVVDDQLLGTEVDATIAAANAISKIGYVGSKRYVRLSMVSTGVTTGATVGATALQGHAHISPVA